MLDKSISEQVLKTMRKILEELKERKIWRTLIAYPSVSFVLLQAVEFFINNYDLDARYLSATFIACVAFLPVALIWNWYHGETGHQDFRKTEIGAYALFTLVAISLVAWFWLSTDRAARSLATPAAPVRSIAVMPFLNPGEDASVQYLCDGIAESLINWLAAQDAVKVSSKSASFHLRDDTENATEIGERLGVESVLQGKLERVGDQIMISASLVDARDGSQIWGERLMRPDSELLYLERNIVDAITAGLKIKVTDSGSKLAASGGTDNPEAYEKYLRGHFLIQATETDSIDEGLKELRASIRLDPAFGLPYADIADALVQKIYYAMERSPELVGEARTAAMSAVALAPGSAEARAALADIYAYFDFNWAAAEQAFDEAVALNPNSPVPYHRYSDFLWLTLRPTRAVEMAYKAVELDPIDSSSMHGVGFSLLVAGDYDASAKALSEWNRFHPQSTWSYVKYAVASSLNGQCDIAMERLAAVRQMTNDEASMLRESWMALSYHLCNEQALFARSAERLEADLAEDGVGDPAALIWLRLMQGDIESSIDIIEQAIESRSDLVPFVQLFGNEVWGLEGSKTLARDPRYIEMVKALNFPAVEN
jgi:TolB-like protein/tetratricopeptide (TPR) repeat protein